MRDQKDVTSNVTTHYDTPPERIFNEVRNSDGGIIVLSMKGGKPTLWTDQPDAKAQAVLAEFFPSAVLPESSAELGRSERSRQSEPVG